MVGAWPMLTGPLPPPWWGSAQAVAANAAEASPSKRPIICFIFILQVRPGLIRCHCASVRFCDATGDRVIPLRSEAATRTTSPVTSESAGLRMTLSDGVTPWTISIVVPKSRPTLISRSSTWLSGFTTPTCNPWARNNKVLFGRVTICPNELSSEARLRVAARLNLIVRVVEVKFDQQRPGIRRD